MLAADGAEASGADAPRDAELLLEDAAEAEAGDDAEALVATLGAAAVASQADMAFSWTHL